MLPGGVAGFPVHFELQDGTKEMGTEIEVDESSSVDGSFHFDCAGTLARRNVSLVRRLPDEITWPGVAKMSLQAFVGDEVIQNGFFICEPVHRPNLESLMDRAATTNEHVDLLVVEDWNPSAAHGGGSVVERPSPHQRRHILPEAARADCAKGPENGFHRRLLGKGCQSTLTEVLNLAAHGGQ